MTREMPRLNPFRGFLHAIATHDTKHILLNLFFWFFICVTNYVAKLLIEIEKVMNKGHQTLGENYNLPYKWIRRMLETKIDD